MYAQEALKKRYSCREYQVKPIHKDIISNLIDVARFAPTARNVQPWEFVAISEKAKLAKIGSLAENGYFVKDCACCIVILCKDTKYYLEDGCAATENILLCATDLGLGSCWVAGDKKPYCEEIKKMLGVPKEFKLVSMIALGYPKRATAELHPKKNLNELLHWEKF
jgi:nitroreductase